MGIIFVGGNNWRI